MNFENSHWTWSPRRAQHQFKIFSPTSAHFGNDQNANTNVIDWSFPGVLPVLNKGVIDAGIKQLLHSTWTSTKDALTRKNYFYPDNPKAYQISQFDEPIGYNGWIEVESRRRYDQENRYRTCHLEEDAGKNTTVQMVTLMLTSIAKGALIEIVSEADIVLRRSLRLSDSPQGSHPVPGISDVKMEEGSMRVDANISLRPYGQEKFGTKTELKNLNSFSNVR